MSAAPAYRAVFALGVGLLGVGVAVGVLASYRADHRPPSIDLIVGGAADHVESLLARRDYDAAVRELVLYASTSGDSLPHDRFRRLFPTLDADGRAELAAALRRHPGYADGHYQLALRHAADGELAEAVAELEEVLRLRPDDPEVLNDLGAVLAQQGRFDEAAARLRRALVLQPDYEAARVNLEQLSDIATDAPASDR